MRGAAVLAVALLLGGACGGRKEARKGPQPCSVDDDCPQGLKCVADKCEDWRSKSILTAPETTVKPADVGKQVDQIQQQHERQIDNVMREGAKEP